MERVVEDVTQAAGSDVKGIMLANFEQSRWSTPYIRESAKDEFSESALEEIFQQFGLESVMKGIDGEGPYSPMGELTEDILVFEDRIVLVRFDNYRGVIVGLERNLDCLAAVIEATEKIFDEYSPEMEA